MLRTFIFAALTAVAACRAQVALGGAQSGFVVDHAARTIRPVIGMPGAAYLGRAVALPFPVREAEVRGEQAVAIGAEEESRAYLIRGLAGANPAVTALESATAVYLSERGTVAVLVNAREETIRFVTALDTAPVVSIPVTGSARMVAFDGESGCAFLLVRSELRTVCAARPAEPRILRDFAGMDVTAMVYSAAHGGLFVADRVARRVVRIAPPVETSEPEILAESIAEPVGLRPISKNEIAVVQAEPARAVTIDLRRRAVSGEMELPMPAEKLDYLAAGRILELSRVNRSPLMVIDLAQDRAAFLIPPAGDLQ